MMRVWRLSVAYIGPKSRIERPRETKIGTEVAHVTRDSDTTFKIKRSKVYLRGRLHIVAASRTACYYYSPVWVASWWGPCVVRAAAGCDTRRRSRWKRAPAASAGWWPDGRNVRSRVGKMMTRWSGRSVSSRTIGSTLLYSSFWIRIQYNSIVTGDEPN